MNLLTFKHEGPVAGHDDLYNTGILGRRWALMAHHNFGLAYIGFERQLLHNGASEWGGCLSYFLIGFQKKFRFGYSSDWYDGQHRIINLGWFFINWSL